MSIAYHLVPNTARRAGISSFGLAVDILIPVGPCCWPLLAIRWNWSRHQVRCESCSHRLWSLHWLHRQQALLVRCDGLLSLSAPSHQAELMVPRGAMDRLLNAKCIQREKTSDCQTVEFMVDAVNSKMCTACFHRSVVKRRQQPHPAFISWGRTQLDPHLPLIPDCPPC